MVVSISRALILLSKIKLLACEREANIIQVTILDFQLCLFNSFSLSLLLFVNEVTKLAFLSFSL